jgi:hypothetical protein
MRIEVYTRVGMLDRAGGMSSFSHELFRFSTTGLKWEELDATRVSGSPPSRRSGHGMVSVRRDIYVFGGYIWSSSGEEWLCEDGHLVCMPDKVPKRRSTRCCCACCHILCSGGGMPCSAAPGSGDA